MADRHDMIELKPQGLKAGMLSFVVAILPTHRFWVKLVGHLADPGGDDGDPAIAAAIPVSPQKLALHDRRWSVSAASLVTWEPAAIA